MAARKRRDDETFEQYRESLKHEDSILKIKLSGTLLWNSSKDGTIYAVETPHGRVYTYVNPKLSK